MSVETTLTLCPLLVSSISVPDSLVSFKRLNQYSKQSLFCCARSNSCWHRIYILTTLTFQAAIETCTILISLDPDPMWVKLCDLYHPKEFLSFVPLFKPVKVNIYQSFTIQSSRDGKVSNLNDEHNSKKSKNLKPINLINFYRQSLLKL